MTAEPTSDTAPRHRRRASVLTVGLVVLVMLAGCDDSDDVNDEFGAAAEDNGAATIDPDTPPTAPSPEDDTETQGADVPQAGEPPPLDGLYSEDELEVARAINAYWSWLLRHPDTDPELVERIFTQPEESDGTTFLDGWQETIRQYQEHRWWWTGGTSEVEHVEVLDDQLPNTRLVRVYYHRAERAELVDAEGQVHSDREPARKWWDETWVREDSESPWKVVSVGDSGEWEGDDL